MELDVLAFGAHPDDIELTCAGTIIKLGKSGYKTGVISLTQGELGTRGTAEIRAKEFEASGKIMGLNAHKMLDIPDGIITVSRENKLKLIREIREYRPKIVLTFYWEVRHPDHGYASDLVREAAFLAGLKKIETGQEAFRPQRVLYYADRYEFKPSFIVDITDTHEDKLRAIQCYKSQFHNPEKEKYGSDETNISRPEFLEAIITRAKQYGSYIGVQYGEPFLVREPLRVDDPVRFLTENSTEGFL